VVLNYPSAVAHERGDPIFPVNSTVAVRARCLLFAGPQGMNTVDRCQPLSPPKWLQDCIDEMNDAVQKGIAGEHERIGERARAYSIATAGWLQKAGTPGHRDSGDPRTTLAHDCALIPAKIYRALNDGFTQVALLSIDRSRAAWVRTITRGLAQRAEVEPFVSELGVLAAELERAFPGVRASTE